MLILGVLIRKKWALTLFTLVLSALSLSASQPKEFRNWPAGTSPTDVGKRVAERFVSTVKLDQEAAIYPAMCTWYGALSFAQLTNERPAEPTRRHLRPAIHSGLCNLCARKAARGLFRVGSRTPADLHRNRQAQYLTNGINFADHQWESPTPDGLSRETRYWIDDMYMITVLQVQAYRATGNTKYLDRAALEMTAYLDKLQQPNGLFYHSPDAPFFWGRGNGWVAAGMAEYSVLCRRTIPSAPASWPPIKR